jgi:transposase
MSLGTDFFKKQRSVNMSKTVLGTDISKKKMDILLILNGKLIKNIFENTAKGFKLFYAWLEALHVEHEVHICMEATGPYSEPLAEFLFEKGCRVSMVNPLKIHEFGGAQLRRNKTDAADARLIADFCLAMKPELWRPLPPEMKQLQALTRRIESLDQILQAEKNRLKESAPPEVQPSLQRMIDSIEKEIEEVTKLIKEHIDNNPTLKEQSDLLRSIPGIGEKTVPLLLGEIQFAAFDSARSVAAFAGLTPMKDQSGSSLNKTKLSKLGSGRVRKALYFPAIVALKYNGIIKNLAGRLSRKGLKPKQVVCAAMHKLLHIAFGVLKHHRPYDPNLAFNV